MAKFKSLDERDIVKYQENDKKVQEIIDLILEKLEEEQYSHGKFLLVFKEMIDSNEFDKSDFLSLHRFLVYDITKNKMLSSFITFFTRMVIKKLEIVPLEVKQYQNYLKGIEYLKHSFIEQDIILEDITYSTCRPPKNKDEFNLFATAALQIFQNDTEILYSHHKKVYDENHISIISQTLGKEFRDDLDNLVEFYGVSTKTDIKNLKLISSIYKYFGLKYTLDQN